MATMLVCRELATLNRKRPHGQARLQKAMELEECLRSVVPLALRQTKLAFISRAPYGPMFSLLKKLHIKRGLNECFIHQHKSEIPHTECASIDVRTLNRVKDKIFFSTQGRFNSLFGSGDRWAFVERERRGGWWVFMANERGALLKLFSFSFFPLTPLLPFQSFLLTLCSHLCISFSFFFFSEGWVEHDFQRQRI